MNTGQKSIGVRMTTARKSPDQKRVVGVIVVDGGATGGHNGLAGAGAESILERGIGRGVGMVRILVCVSAIEHTRESIVVYVTYTSPCAF